MARMPGGQPRSVPDPHGEDYDRMMRQWLAQKAPITKPSALAQASEQFKSGSPLEEAALQADAAVRGAANVMTLGGANHLAAGMDALLSPGGLGDWRRRYNANLEQQEALDRYNEAHRPIANTLGNVAGTALGLGLVGPMEGGLAAAPRLAGAAKLTAKEAGAILAAGGATGLGSQAVSDMASHHQSSWGDNFGAMTGGVAGAAALPLGPARAGAVDGAVTSAAQDFFNGRPVSSEQAGESALTGNLFGGLAGIVGRNWSNGLSPRAKGRLGEKLGGIRRQINGQGRTVPANTRDPLGNSRKDYWIPDGWSGETRFEDKFGISADLTPNQRRARALLGPRFQLNSFVPADIGMIAGAPAGAAAPQVVRTQRRK